MSGSASTVKVCSKTPAEFFDAMFVSTRAAHWLESDAANELLKNGGLVAIETSKFLVPLNHAQKDEFDSKLNEYCTKHTWKKINGIFICIYNL